MTPEINLSNADDLTDKQLIRRLRAMEKRWPVNVGLYVMDGVVSLARIDLENDDPVSADACIATFGGIPADGGGW